MSTGYTDRDVLDYGGTRELRKASARPFGTKLHRILTAELCVLSVESLSCDEKLSVDSCCCAVSSPLRCFSALPSAS